MPQSRNWNSLRRWLPPRPTVPPLLWATLAAAALAGLNLVFYAEVWTRGRADGAAWAALLGLGLLAGPQVARVLWRWPPPPAAPFWVQWLWRTMLQAAAVAGVIALIFVSFVLIMLLLYTNAGVR